MKNYSPAALGPVIATTLFLSLMGTSASAEAPLETAYTLEPFDDTLIKVLDEDLFHATSRSGNVAFGLGFALTDATPRVAMERDVETPESLVFEVGVQADIIPTDQLSMNYGKIEVTYRHFDGRLLTARDLTREQGYEVSVGWELAGAVRYRLYSGDRLVATVAAREGVAPFVLDRAPDGAEARSGTSSNGGKQIEIHSFSWGATTVSFPGGSRVEADRLVIEVEVAEGHEVGHWMGLHHVHVDTVGVSAMTIAIE